MRITAIELFHIAAPFVVPYRLSKVYGTHSEAHAVVLRLETEGGVVGYGEADPCPPFTEETPGSVLRAIGDHLGPALLGTDARNVNAAHQLMDAILTGNPLAKGAVDMACYDIAGKAASLPVHDLLGGALCEDLPVMWPLGSGTADEDAALIDEKRAQGYQTFMLKMGDRPVAEDLARVRALRNRYGPALRLVADANQGWTPAEARVFVDGVGASAGASVDDGELDLIEQPVSARDIAGLARLKRGAATPLSADESLVTERDALGLIEADAVDVFSLKVSKNGGIAPTRRLAALAHTAGLRCLMNSMLEFGVSQAASLELGVTVPNLVDFGHAYMSTLRLAEDYTDFSDRVRDGRVRPSGCSGLGVAVDEDRLRHMAREVVRLEASAQGSPHGTSPEPAGRRS